VTGGAGFIGSHLVEAFAVEGWNSIVVDNLATGRRDTIDEIGAGAGFVEGSIADRAVVDRAFSEQPEVVIHCAASYKDPEAWTEDLLTNALGTANIVEAAKRAGVRRLVYFQTALCYGNRPLEQPITLAHPLRPESSYAISKTAGEQYIALGGVDFVSFRLANVYGPRNVSGPIPTFYRRLRAGEPCTVVDTRRDFLYVDDLVDVVLRAVNGQGSSGYYHVSSGSDYSIEDLYDTVALALGVDQRADRRPRGADDAPTILLDPTKTNEEFDWQTTTALDDGVRAAVEWYDAHGVGETYTHLRLKG
jgi:UDP-glucose 4-epimerase